MPSNVQKSLKQLYKIYEHECDFLTSWHNFNQSPELDLQIKVNEIYLY